MDKNDSKIMTAATAAQMQRQYAQDNRSIQQASVIQQG